MCLDRLILRYIERLGIMVCQHMYPVKTALNLKYGGFMNMLHLYSKHVNIMETK